MKDAASKKEKSSLPVVAAPESGRNFQPFV